MFKNRITSAILAVLLVIACVACQRGTHQTAGASVPSAKDVPAYTVGADYNQSPSK